MEQPTALPMNGTIDTPAGRLSFVGGYPTHESVEALHDQLDFQRAVQAYLWAIPLVSFAQWHEAHETVFGARDGDLVLYTTYRDKLGLLTSNTTTPYILGMLDLGRTGPVVFDYPKGPTAGAILDFWQRPVTDMGLTGPDKGAGNRYLLLGPGQSVEDESGYTVIRAPMNHIFHGFRVLSAEPAEAKALREGYHVYPHARRSSPPRTRIVTPDGKPWAGKQPGGLAYWRLLARMIGSEPVHERDRVMVATLRPLGIEKDRPFEPDARQTAILEKASLVGEAMARAMTYAKRQKAAVVYPGRHWKWLILLEPNQEAENHTALDERTTWFYEAVTLSDGMTTKTPGQGQAYIGAYADENGNWLQGGRNYTLRVPPNPPVAQFWGVTAYDAETRCFIDNPYEIAGRDSRDPLISNTDGSVDIHFGPEPPKGQEANWIPTVEGRGWFAYFRFYAPTERYFDLSWQLPDIVPLA